MILLRSRTILLLLLCSCNGSPKIENRTTKIETVSTDESPDTVNTHHETRVKETQNIQKYFYPNKSHCGGALYGIYQEGELIRIESTFGAELGYSSKDVDLKKGKITRITYREHYADYDQYRERFPDEETIDPDRMTYTDTLYVLDFGKKSSFKKYAGKKLITTLTDEELTNRLLSCVDAMKKELASEKQLVHQ